MVRGEMHHVETSALSEVKKSYWYIAFLPLFIVPLFFLTACGKKGEPTLKAYEKPVPPAALQAIHREMSILLAWSYPIEKEHTVAEFIILKSSGTEFEKLVHIEKSKRSYEDTDFEKGGNYRYKIIARSFKGVYSDDSNIVATSPLNPPRPPSDLSFSTQGNALLLAWKPEEKGLLYNVYKSLEKGKYGMSPVNSRPISDSSFTDSFNINTTVYYTVRTLHATGIRDEGAPSRELAVDPAELVPSPLKNFRYHAASDRIYLYWDEPEESWVNRFRIYRRTAGQDYQLIGETQIPVFVDKEPALTKRDYRLHAAGPAKEGPGIEIRGVIYTAPPE